VSKRFKVGGHINHKSKGHQFLASWKVTLDVIDSRSYLSLTLELRNIEFFKEKMTTIWISYLSSFTYCCIIQLSCMFIWYFLYNLNANKFVNKLSYHQEIWLNYRFCNWLIADLFHFGLFLSFIQVSPFSSINLFCFLHLEVILYSLNFAIVFITYHV